ncbi:pyrroloquinoline quinone biosynthesis protein PqqB [Rhizobium sp. YK2]|nr:pyrroloquinoline quinone biosynthesis protein PqqB [Rhizobium sp. YK2]
MRHEADKLRFLVLGAAAGGGLPQWNCGCLNCNMARDPSAALRPQTQSSLAVTLDGESWTIMNASPDIRQQLIDNRPLSPKSLRDTPIESVIITNGDIDHIAGLLVLRESQGFKLFTSPSVANILGDNPIFRALNPAFVALSAANLDHPFQPLAGMSATLFAVPGKVPLFMETDDLQIGIEDDLTIGVEIVVGDARAYYIPGCAQITDALAARLDGASLVFFDGTVFSDDEMIVTGTGHKTGRRMGHIPISGAEGSLEILSRLSIPRKIYVHINNTNPIWRHSPERDFVLEHGFEIARDGMEVTLALDP